MEAEEHLKAELKKAHAGDGDNRYQPANYYGRFLKEQIEKAQAEGGKIRINPQFFKEMFWGVWMVADEDTRNRFRNH